MLATPAVLRRERRQRSEPAVPATFERFFAKACARDAIKGLDCPGLVPRPKAGSAFDVRLVGLAHARQERRIEQRAALIARHSSHDR